MIEVCHLTKRYGDHTAVSDLSFQIEKGQIYGLLGPNGAGKSTTMNIMTGCLSASSGDVTIDGYDVFEEPEQAKRKIGYLPEIPPVYGDRTPREYLKFVAEAKKVPAAERKQQIESVLKQTGTDVVADRLISNLSKGYRQRVGIAQALLGNPEVIILDEPTVGLDPLQIIEIRDLIRELGKEHTVILSSHILSEVQAVCTTVLIIAKGKLVACDTPENLEKLFRGTATITLCGRMTEQEMRSVLSGVAEAAKATLEKKPEGKTSATLEIPADQEDRVCEKLFLAFANAKKPLLSLNSGHVSLEDIFIELTNNPSDEPEESDESDEPAEEGEKEEK